MARGRARGRALVPAARRSPASPPTRRGSTCPCRRGRRRPARGATVVHPGAASPARRWPPERWAAVARAERRAGRRVVVTGAAASAASRRRSRMRPACRPPPCSPAARTCARSRRSWPTPAGCCAETRASPISPRPSGPPRSSSSAPRRRPNGVLRRNAHSTSCSTAAAVATRTPRHRIPACWRSRSRTSWVLPGSFPAPCSRGKAQRHGYHRQDQW